MDVSGGAAGPRRAGRVLRRRLRRRAGLAALRLAGHPGHRDAGAPADGHRRGALRGRGGGLRHRPGPVHGGGRAVRGGRQLRTTAPGAGHAHRAGRVVAQGARGGQQELRVDVRQRGPGRGVPGRPSGHRAELPAAAADPQRDGAAQRGLLLRGRRVHPLVIHPDPARAAGHAGPGDRDPGAEHPGHRAGRGRRLRLQAAGHGRGSAGHADRPQARPAGQVDRVAQRGQPDRAPRPGSVAADQDRGRARRPAARPVRGPARGHGRLPDAGHPGGAAARRVHVQRHLQDGRVLVPLHRGVHDQDADRRLPRRRAARRPRSPSSGSWTSWPPSWAWIRWRCGSGTGSSTRSSRTPRSPG